MVSHARLLDLGTSVFREVSARVACEHPLRLRRINDSMNLSRRCALCRRHEPSGGIYQLPAVWIPALQQTWRFPACWHFASIVSV